MKVFASSHRFSIGLALMCAITLLILNPFAVYGQSYPFASPSGDGVAGFGNAVATCISSDGTPWYFIHSPLEGKVYVWRFGDNNVWTQTQVLTVDVGIVTAGGIFTFNKTIAAENNILVVGEPAAGGFGGFRIFNYSAPSWSAGVFLPSAASGYRGASVDIAGTLIAVGSPEAPNIGGRVEIFTNQGVLLQTLLTRSSVADGERFGTSVAMDGTRLVVSAPYYGDRVGRVYSFKHNGSTYEYEKTFGSSVIGEVATTGPADYHYGYSVDVSKDRIAVGASVADPSGVGNRGQIWIYKGQDSAWTREYYNSPFASSANDQAGYSISIRDSVVVTGFPYNTIGAEANGGGVAIFKKVGGSWSEDPLNLTTYSNPSGGWVNRVYGFSVSLGPNGYLAVGAPGQSGRPGSAYVYELIPRPTNIAATDNQASNTTISWDKRGAFAMTSRVYRQTTSTLINTTPTNTSYNDAAGNPWQIYTYLVSMSNDFGESQTRSDVGRKISPVASVSASDGAYTDRIVVTWTLPAGFSTAGIQGFRIYRKKTTDANYGTPVSVGPATVSYNDFGVEPALSGSSPSQYIYDVRPYQSATEGGSVIDQGWRLRAIATISASDGAYTDRTRITWSAVAGATSYSVFRGTTLLTANPIVTTTYDDLGGTAGVAYDYSVRVNGAGFTAADTAMDSGGKFSGPPVVTASEGVYDNRVQLNWTYTARYESGLRINRRDLNTGTVETIATGLSGGLTNFADNSAVPGVLYEYCVEAYNGSVTVSGCDPVGWRAPNGSINGSILTQAGGGSEGVYVYAASPYARALQCDGNGDYVNVSGITLNNTSFTIEFWAKRTAINSASWAVGQGTGSQNLGLSIGFYANNNPVFGFYGNDLEGPPDTSLTWHHWAVTFNRTTGERSLYRDGELYASDVAEELYGGSGAFRIGSSPVAGFFNGTLDEVRIWDVVRAQSEIQRDAGRLLTSNINLLAYYPMDVAVGTIVPDYSQNSRHGTLINAISVNTVAPVYNGAFTNASGGYSISKVTYGSSQQFTVTPRKISPATPTSFPKTIPQGDTLSTMHQFSPSSRSITLASGGAVANGVDFTDQTSFTMSGIIQFLDLGNQSASGVCFADNIGFTVNGQTIPTITDAQGKYSISRAPGNYTIVPVKTGHTFVPPSYVINSLNQNLPSLHFEDYTKAKLTLRAMGGCDASIGTVKIFLQSVNLCFSETVTVAGTSVIEVPPLNYNATVTSVSTGNPAQDLAIKEYFDEKGSKPVNLSLLNASTNAFEDTLEFIYHSPAFIEVLGFPAPQTITLPLGGGTINVPVLQTLNTVNLTIRVFERYIDGADTNTCPVKNVTVKIHNDITGESPEDSLRLDSLGYGVFRLIPGLPNIAIGGAHPLQKRFEVVADVDGQFPTFEQWALVLGERPRPATFTTVTPELPLTVLHDPPGDLSSSFLESGHNACVTWSMFAEEAVGAGVTSTAFFGTKLLLITGLGVEVGEEQEAIGSLTKSINVSQSLKGGYENEVCVGVTERFSTDENEVINGPRSDVFIGGAVNLIYALTDVLKLEGSTIVRDTNFAVAADGFATKYIYSENFIRYSLLPTLEVIKGIKLGEGDTFGADSVQNSIDVWQQILDQNVANLASAQFLENRSFDAGPLVSYSNTSTRSESRFIDFGLAIEEEIAAEAGFKVAGTGGSAKVIVNFALRAGFTNTEATTTYTTVGYTLGDNDLGDVFSVDIKRDRQYGTVAFDLRSGGSSCPWEPWFVDPDAGTLPRTLQRSNPKLTVAPAERNNVDPQGTASFTLNLSNMSESEELWVYKIVPMQSSNPDGAVIKINGDFSQEYAVDPGATQVATLTVTRGPEAYIYPNLKVLVYNQCDYDIFSNGGAFYGVDTATVTVRFQQACSEIRIADPDDGWIVNRSSNGVLPITMADFDLSNTDLEEIAMQYARETDQIWTNLPQATFLRNPDGTWETQEGAPVVLDGGVYGFPWVLPSGLPDGKYKLRAVTRCKTLGSFYSAVVRGTIDRSTPLVFGHPWPTDGILSTGDDVKVEFNEFIDCAALTSDRFELRDALAGVRVPLDFICNFNGTQVVLTPRGVSFDEMRGKTYQMTIPGAFLINNVERGVRDLYGNVLQKGVSWAFYVGDSVVTWDSPLATTLLNVGEGGIIVTSLHNSATEPIQFTIDSLPPWLQATPPSGVIPAGGSLPITFTISGSIGVGEFQVLVFATMTPVPPLKGSESSFSSLANAHIPLTIAVNVGTGAAPLSWSPSTIATAAQQGQSKVLNATLSNLGSDTLEVDLTELPAWLTTSPLHHVLPPNSDKVISLTTSASLPNGTHIASLNAATTSGAMALPIYLIVNATGTNPGGMVVQSIPVGKGWSWISLGVDVTGKSIDTVLASIRDSSSSGDIISGKNGSSQYSPASQAWIGTIGTLVPGESYRLYRSKPSVLSVSAIPVNPSTVVPVAPGWNYLGYLPLSSIAASQALASLNPTSSAGDVMKGSAGSMMYSPTDGMWFGSPSQLEPGEGYRLFSKNGGNLTYVNGQNNSLMSSQSAIPAFNQSTMAKVVSAEPMSVSTTISNQVDPSLYAHSMTIAGAIAEGNSIIGSGDMVLMAYVGSELRGVAQFVKIPSLDQYRAIMTVFSNIPSGEPISFRVGHDSTTLTYSVQPDIAMSFKADTIRGTIQSPMIFRGTFDDGLAQFTQSLIPNWNMIALPLAPPDRRKTALYPSALSKAFRFTPGAGYTEDDTLDNGVGYWVNFGGIGDIGYTGSAVDSVTISLSAGWNLVGGISGDVPVPQVMQNPPNSLISMFFAYGQGGYTADSVVRAGKAYWIRTSQNCQITLKVRLSAADMALAMTDISKLSMEELPPPPPTGDGFSADHIPLAVPTVYALDQNYPNPFNPKTMIRYQLPEESKVSLVIYNVLGQEVAAIANGIEASGFRVAEWDASSISSGVYFYRLEATSTADPTRTFMQIKKMVLVK